MSDIELKATGRCILWMCTYTLKTLVVAMIFGYALLYFLLSVPEAGAATLRPHALVAGEEIRLSDVFADLPGESDPVLGKAPAIGRDMVLGVRTLEKIAKAYQLDWTPSSSRDQCLLRREVHTITSRDMAERIEEALVSSGNASAPFSVEISSNSAGITLPANLPATVEIASLDYTPGQDMFTATLVSPSADNPVKTLSVTGKVRRSLSVPVLRTALRAGDIIGSADIDWLDVPESGLARNIITDADALVGKTPVRSIQTGRPVLEREVASPQKVARGDDVLILFHAGTLELSAKGRAMQNGAEGDFVRIMNLSSNKSVIAEVTGDRQVRVQ